MILITLVKTIHIKVNLLIVYSLSFAKVMMVYGQILDRVSRSVKKMSDRIAFQGLTFSALLEVLVKFA